MASFDLPKMYEHPSGWGPPRHEDGLPFPIPYTPYGKADRLCRIAEWVPPDMMRGRGRGGRYVARTAAPPPAEEGEEGEKWSVADYHKTQGRMRRGRGRGRGAATQRGGMGVRRPGAGRGGQAVPKSKRKLDNRADYRRKDIHRTASIEVKSTWSTKATLPLSDLKKYAEVTTNMKDSSGVVVPKANTIHTAGAAMQYNPVFDKASFREPMTIKDMGRTKENCSVTDSALIRKVVADLSKKGGVQVYATDALLATLMCARQSTNAWDITIERLGDVYFLDWRKGGPIDLFTVNETSNEPPPCEEPANATEEQKLNTQPMLSEELTQITSNFSQQVLAPKPVTGKRAVSEAQMSDELSECGLKPAHVIYRYKKWEVKDVNPEEPIITFVARCHVDGYADHTNTTFRAFTVFDPTLNAWRNKLPGQEGAVTASEIKNNSSRMAKQTCMSLLSGADSMKIGFVQRRKSDDRTNHHLVHVMKQDPKTFCLTVAMSYRGMWNVLNKIMREVIKAKDGTPHQRFILLKEPNKMQLTVCHCLLSFLTSIAAGFSLHLHTHPHSCTTPTSEAAMLPSPSPTRRRRRRRKRRRRRRRTRT